jgi:hypothetical protein
MGALNKENIALYAQKMAERAVESAFGGRQEYVGAKDLENLVPIAQVNHFLMEQTFSLWAESKKNFSLSYFDFHDAEVKNALDNFFNILSRHFALDKAFLGKSLESAVKKTFLLLLNPKEFYLELISSKGDSFNFIKDLSPAFKFITTHQHLKSRLYELLKSAASADGSISREAALKATELAFEQNKDFDSPAVVLRQFADYEPLMLTDIYSEHEVADAETNDKRSEPEAEKAFETPVFVADTDENLTSLKILIPNELEFDFIRVLFNDSRAEYSEAIEALDKIQSYTEAILFVKNNYFRKNAWDLEREEVKRFYEILSGRY